MHEGLNKRSYNSMFNQIS